MPLAGKIHGIIQPKRQKDPMLKTIIAARLLAIVVLNLFLGNLEARRHPSRQARASKGNSRLIGRSQLFCWMLLITDVRT